MRQTGCGLDVFLYFSTFYSRCFMSLRFMSDGEWLFSFFLLSKTFSIAVTDMSKTLATWQPLKVKCVIFGQLAAINKNVWISPKHSPCLWLAGQIDSPALKWHHWLLLCEDSQTNRTMLWSCHRVTMQTIVFLVCLFVYFSNWDRRKYFNRKITFQNH